MVPQFSSCQPQADRCATRTTTTVSKMPVQHDDGGMHASEKLVTDDDQDDEQMWDIWVYVAALGLLLVSVTVWLTVAVVGLF